MRALLAMIRKEFLQLRQDSKMIPAMIVGPIVQLVALGYAANLDVRHVPLLLVDQDRSAQSRALLQRFTGSGYFDLVGSADSTDDVEAWLVHGRAQLALVVGSGYGAELVSGRRAQVQVLADGSDANSAVVGLGYAARILGEVGAQAVATQLRVRSRAAGVPVAVGQTVLEPRIWYNPDLKSRWFYVPAVLAMVLMLVTMNLPSMAVVREKELGTLEQLIVTPLQPWQLVLGKLAPFVVIGMLDMTVIASLIVWVFGVPLKGSFALLFGLTLLFVMNTLGLGLLVSTLVKTQQQAMMFSVFALMLPMIYLSGLIFPIENMPHGIQVASQLIPVRYYATVLRGVFLRGSGLGVLWPEALILLGSGLLVLTLAALRFRKSLD